MISIELRNKLLNLPMVRCNSPIKIRNPYLNMDMYVPCRKCSSCLSLRSSILSQRVENECKQHVYSIFFTLTYDNAHIPLLKPYATDGDMKSFISDRVVFGSYESLKTQVCLDNVYCPDSVMKMCHPRSRSKVDILDEDYRYTIGYVSKIDIRNFLKRLRENIFRKVFHEDKKLRSKFPLRYFITSEYGSDTYRPHYHGILWTDSKAVNEWLIGSASQRSGSKDCGIYQSWKMCNPSLLFASNVISGSAASYVASYVNGIVDLPKVLQTELTRPFVMASKNPIIGSFKIDKRPFEEALLSGTLSKGRYEKSSDDLVSLSDFRLFFGFPKRCYQYNFKSFVALFVKYTNGKYEKSKVATDKFVPVYDYVHNDKYFNPADYYFVRNVCSYYIHRICNNYNISWYQYLNKVYTMIRNFKRRSNELYYYQVNSSPFDCEWLSYYPNLLIQLPDKITLEDFMMDFGLGEVEYSYLYNGDKLDIDFVHSLLRKNRWYYAQRHALHIKHSMVTKIFNSSHDLYCEYV